MDFRGFSFSFPSEIYCILHNCQAAFLLKTHSFLHSHIPHRQRCFPEAFRVFLPDDSDEFCIGWIWMNGKAYDVSSFHSYLYVIAGFKLTIKYGVFFHAHEGCVMVCLGIAVPTIKCSKCFLIFFLSWKNIFFELAGLLFYLVSFLQAWHQCFPRQLLPASL